MKVSPVLIQPSEGPLSTYWVIFHQSPLPLGL